MKERIIERKIRFCPFCEKEHEVITKEVEDSCTIKGEEIKTKTHIFYCEETKSTYANGQILDDNLMAFRDAYREKHNLLTSKEIISIRDKYGISQEDLANILNLGAKTITRYETNTIQDKPYDTLLREFNHNYIFAYNQLKQNREKFPVTKYKRMLDNINSYLEKESPRMYEFSLQNRYITQGEENSINGYSLLSIPKIKNMLVYFANTTNDLYSVKLMKLFWYADALTYIKTNKAMTGLTYTHMKMGALPIGYVEICNLDSIDRQYEETLDNMACKLLPKQNISFDKSLFSKQELEVLKEVSRRFKDIPGHQISEIMHQEDIYKNTKEKEIIHYTKIKALKAFH